MVIRIISIGTLKEKYLVDACNEYIKRLSKFAKIEIIELKESKIYDESVSNINKALLEEKDKIEKVIKNTDYLVCLDINGEQISSIDLAKTIENISLKYSTIDFIIGSSYGLNEDFKNNCNFKLSFSKMTFPHQLFKVMLLEQIYRSYKIINNENYHK